MDFVTNPGLYTEVKSQLIAHILVGSQIQLQDGGLALHPGVAIILSFTQSDLEFTTAEPDLWSQFLDLAFEEELKWSVTHLAAGNLYVEAG